MGPRQEKGRRCSPDLPLYPSAETDPMNSFCWRKNAVSHYAMPARVADLPTPIKLLFIIYSLILTSLNVLFPSMPCLRQYRKWSHSSLLKQCIHSPFRHSPFPITIDQKKQGGVGELWTWAGELDFLFGRKGGLVEEDGGGGGWRRRRRRRGRKEGRRKL